MVKHLEDKTFVVGEQVEFTCVLNKPVLEKDVNWYANGSELQPDDSWTMKNDGCAYTLILKKAQVRSPLEITFAAQDAISVAKLVTLGKCNLFIQHSGFANLNNVKNLMLHSCNMLNLSCT